MCVIFSQFFLKSLKLGQDEISKFKVLVKSSFGNPSKKCET